VSRLWRRSGWRCVLPRSRNTRSDLSIEANERLPDSTTSRLWIPVHVVSVSISAVDVYTCRGEVVASNANTNLYLSTLTFRGVVTRACEMAAAVSARTSWARSWRQWQGCQTAVNVEALFQEPEKSQHPGSRQSAELLHACRWNTLLAVDRLSRQAFAFATASPTQCERVSCQGSVTSRERQTSLFQVAVRASGRLCLHWVVAEQGVSS